MWFSVKDFKQKKGPNGPAPAPDTITQLHPSKQTSPVAHRLTREHALLDHSCASWHRWEHRLHGTQVKHSFSINYIYLYNEELNHLISPVSVCVAVLLVLICYLINWRTPRSEAVGQLVFLTQPPHGCSEQHNDRGCSRRLASKSCCLASGKTQTSYLLLNYFENTLV